MNRKKLLVIVILSIFVVGMVMGAASASHTFKKGKYKVTVSDKKYKKLKKHNTAITKKVGYKTKKYYGHTDMITEEYWTDNYGNIIKDKIKNPYAKLGKGAIVTKTVWYKDGNYHFCKQWFKVPSIKKVPLYMHVVSIDGHIYTGVDTHKTVCV